MGRIVCPMPPVEEKAFRAALRDVMKLLINNMIETTALSGMLVLGRTGPEQLEIAREAARELYQPFLDRLANAEDQSLLDMLRDFEGPPQ